MAPDESDGGKFDYRPGDIVLTQCASCSRFVRDPYALVCPAFPGGIPAEIISNTFDHRKPHPDEVVPKRYVPRDDVDPRALAALYRTLDRL
jgi:hypothetical protein